jgi:hypothetical protein
VTIKLTDIISVCVTSVIRLKSLYEISVSTDTSRMYLSSISYMELTKAVDGVNAGIWSGIEINVGIACSSLPALKPLISKVMPGFLSNLTTKGSLGSVDETANTKMSALRSRRQTQTEEIKVVQSVYQKTDEVPSSSQGSERSLMNWKTDCYSGIQEVKAESNV